MKNKMMNIIITVVGILLLYFLGDFYYEEYQGLFTGFYTGQYSPGTQFFAWYFMGDIGTSYLYSYLYRFFPSIEWVSWIYTIFIGISTILTFQLLDFITRDKLPNCTKIFLKVGLFILIVPLNIFFFNFSRVSYLLCGSSALNFIIRYQPSFTLLKNIRNAYPYILIFILGALTRVEPAMALSMLFVCFAIAWHNSIIQGLKSTLSFVIITLLIVGGIFVDIHYTDEFCKQVEPFTETSFLRNKVIPLSQMKTSLDSMRYEAASHMLWADPQNISVAFLKGLTHITDPKNFRQQRLKETWQDFAYRWKDYHGILVASALFVLFLALSTKDRKKSILLLAYAFALIFLILGQIYYAKLMVRAIYPILAFFLVSIILLYIQRYKKSRIYLGYIYLFAFIIFLTLSHDYSNRIRVAKENYRLNHEIAQKVNQIAKNEILLLNAMSFGNYTNRFRPFQHIHNTETYKLYINEAQLMSLINTYKYYLAKECSCDINNFSNFYKYLLGPNQHKKVYTISDQKRFQLINKYLSTMYGVNIQYKEITEVSLPKVYKMSLEEMYQPRLYQLTGYTISH